ncbi:MAG: hypothetical protein E7Z93_01200 [Cyanobacteria bacterium SIG32]|nr:hypothetical protein [Cyanobacteria bacterium SIG32]
MKQKMLIILGVIFLLWMILFVIQIVDQKVNGEDYEKIKQYTRTLLAPINEENLCFKDNHEVFKMMYHDEYKNPDIAMNSDAFNERIMACEGLMYHIESIEVPQVKSKRKQEQLNLYKLSSIQVAYNYVNYFKIYNACAERNSSCMRSYEETLAQLSSYQKMISSGIRLHLGYSAKEIFILRPMLLWFEYNYNKKIQEYASI